jgi:molybdopterin guanine dinucleotide-containing S/N-oxide reductase-like protein
MKRQVFAACPHDCPDACGVLITVEQLNGSARATKIQGDPRHPVTQGFLCGKVAKYLERVYSPERVLYPMRRKKAVAKGAGGRNARDFERIGWDDALDEIYQRFTAISRDFGPEAILPYSYGGTLGALNNASMDRRFFHRLGASQLDRTICATAGGEAMVSVLGRKLGPAPEDFRHAKYIIAWGANIHGTNIHLWPFIEEARRDGAKLVVIDPYKTRTARLADWYLPINPGTDVALALGMMHVIIGENLHDADYVAQATHGFEQLRQRVREYPPERVAGLTGISADDIRKLAREYAGAKPAGIRVNYGVQRSQNGGSAMRAITMLPCITGAWKQRGGGVQLSTSGAWQLNESALHRPDLMLRSPLGRPARVINMSELGKALTALDNPPVKAVFVYNSNPAAVAPNHNDVIRGFRRPDLFTVVHEQFLTDTADYADLVLPATTFFEHKELQTSYGHYYLQVSNPSIAPLGECRSNVETFRALAHCFGFHKDDTCFNETVDQMIDRALDTKNPLLSGLTRERLEREGYLHINNGTEHFLPFADGKFPTASGKAELYSESLGAMGLDPVVTFIPPAESRHSELSRRYPLELLSRKADNFLNTTFCNLPGPQAMEQTGRLEMNAADAAARGIRDGDQVRIFNDRGAVTLTAAVDGAVQPGVVAARLNWAKLAADGNSINVLTSERLTDIGRGATFYSTLVQVEALAKS